MKLVSLSDPSTRPVAPTHRPRAGGPPSLSVGDRLEAVVLEVRENGLLLLDLGSTRVLAETKLPLGEGERFTARVVRNAPEIVLQILADEPREGHAGLPESLCLFRSKPGLVEDMFRQLAALVESLAEDRGGDRSPLLAAARNSLQSLLSSLIFSGAGTQARDGVRQFLAGLDAPADGDGNPGARFTAVNDLAGAARGTLREALLRLSEAAGRELAAADAGASARRDLQHVASTARSALEVLEVLRDVNNLSRREGGPLVIQMPAAFPGGIRIQDLFIYPEGGREGGDAAAGKSFRVVLCLNMETLGDILVDARLSGGRMTGALSCGTEEVRQYLQSAMDELRERLAAAGLPETGIVCLTDRHIARAILERRHSLPLFQKDAVNVYA
jgi:hypothetical protein